MPRRLSRGLALVLLQQYPHLKKIYVPPSIYRLTSPRVLEALRAAGVDVVPTGRGRGRPRKYDEKTVETICELWRSGSSAREISETLRIPLRTVYYLLRRYCEPGNEGPQTEA